MRSSWESINMTEYIFKILSVIYSIFKNMVVDYERKEVSIKAVPRKILNHMTRMEANVLNACQTRNTLVYLK